MFHTLLFPTSNTGTVTGSGVYNLTLSSDQLNFNLKNYIDAAEGDASAYGTINVTIASGVKIGASNSNNYAFDTGSLASGTTLTITNNGTISGSGGKGGNPSRTSPQNGGAGGNGMIFRLDATLNNAGLIQGGGGGGAGAGDGGNFTTIFREYGGGGAGYVAGGTDGDESTGGTLSAGGFGFADAGDGGDPGSAGSDNVNLTASGGAAGDAIHKNGNTVDISGAGTITGTQSATT